ncbi:MAG: hypothetical protein IT159_04290 [Bryobacterales bacterium]|nr:hypothetical protein [Bryobacterales bacterium]
MRLKGASWGAGLVLCLAGMAAQDTPAPQALKQSEPASPADFVVEPGTRIPLSLINSVSTKGSAEGDRVYLETVFPILVNGRIVIPPGSYVAGTITEVKRPGRVKGRGAMFLRFDSLTLPNGVTRDFRARVGSLDGQASEQLDRGEGKIKSDSNKAGDARTVGETAAAGTSVGVIAGSAAGRPGMGAGVGAAAGAAAGLLGVLLSRGPEVVLARGTTLEMVLDRPVSFTEEEVDFAGISPRRPQTGPGPGAHPSSQERRSIPIPGRNVNRWPY